MTKENVNLKNELKNTLKNMNARILKIEKLINIKTKQKNIKNFEQIMQKKNFWLNYTTAEKIQKKYILLKKEITNFFKIKKIFTDSNDLIKILSNNQDLLDVKIDIKKANIILLEMEKKGMLWRETDIKNAILNINVGQGGIDSQSFALTLLKMYKRYSERKKFKIKFLDYQPGEEVGIKSVTILIKGNYSYGYLKGEIGVHRLVRISPFDSRSRRHTSFASVWVIPEIDNNTNINIKMEDLRIDTFRAKGAGGQHVNKTDSAIRIKHIPTGIIVNCQSERSQIKNKHLGIKLLRLRLHNLEKNKRLTEKNKAESQKLEASFGSQIRNYILSPYKVIKDLRSGYKTNNVESVFDGYLQPFIENYLMFNYRKNKC